MLCTSILGNRWWLNHGSRDHDTGPTTPCSSRPPIKNEWGATRSVRCYLSSLCPNNRFSVARKSQTRFAFSKSWLYPLNRTAKRPGLLLSHRASSMFLGMWQNHRRLFEALGQNCYSERYHVCSFGNQGKR